MQFKIVFKKHFAALLFCLVIAAVVCFLSGQALSNSSSPAPKRMETSDPGNCQACHTGKVMSENHVQTKGMNAKACQACHKEASSLNGKVPLSHQHMWNAISCKQCHGQGDPQVLNADACLVCHKSYEEVAKLTKESDPNPHQSHFGRIECTSCHKIHRKSENACNKCHQLNMKVP